MADPEHVERLKRSVTEWNVWRLLQPINFSADLSESDLSGIDLSYSDLSGADLSGADLHETNLNGVNLSGIKRTTTQIRWTTLGANLGGANLTGADLTEANLSGAYLAEANLAGVNFTKTHFYHTTFAWVDLSCVKELEMANHGGPSNVDINSVALPHDKQIRLHFLRGVGFSDAFIDYLPSLLTTAIQYHSLFIAYAHQDEAFARRLYQDLQDNGVRCWIAPHDLRPGDYHHSRIDEAIHLHEKTLLLLSRHAVNSSWVKHEVQIALAREVQQDCTVLFPLRLDGAVMHTNKDWATRLRESRHIGDFTSWQDDAAYQEAFSRLLRDLRVSRPPTA